jgi:hypothetical protein
MRSLFIALALCFSVDGFAQVPIATQTLLDSVQSAESKSVIRSVLRIECGKDNAKGTGFVVSKVGISRMSRRTCVTRKLGLRLMFMCRPSPKV